MLHIGCHLSSSKGYMAMAQEAVSLGADTFAFFTRNPRGGAAKPLDFEDIKKFNEFISEKKFAPLVAHSPYTLNPCAAKPDLRVYTYDTMVDDLLRLSYTPGNFYNFHPGSHVSQGADAGINLTADLMSRAICAEQGIVENKSFKERAEVKTMLLIETMAGKGSEIGKTFEEVRAIMDQAKEMYLKLTANVSGAADFEKCVGVCLDTCHIWEGGYDLSKLDDVMADFDKNIGLANLKAVHMNDSMNDIGAHKDRHQKIGEGHIGLEILTNVINHSAFKNIPFILETPNEADGYKKEIELLRSRFVE